jgi:hypothetical protein
MKDKAKLSSEALGPALESESDTNQQSQVNKQINKNLAVSQKPAKNNILTQNISKQQANNVPPKQQMTRVTNPIEPSPKV